MMTLLLLAGIIFSIPPVMDLVVDYIRQLFFKPKQEIETINSYQKEN